MIANSIKKEIESLLLPSNICYDQVQFPKNYQSFGKIGEELVAEWTGGKRLKHQKQRDVHLTLNGVPIDIEVKVRTYSKAKQIDPFRKEAIDAARAGLSNKFVVTIMLKDDGTIRDVFVIDICNLFDNDNKWNCKDKRIMVNIKDLYRRFNPIYKV